MARPERSARRGARLCVLAAFAAASVLALPTAAQAQEAPPASACTEELIGTPHTGLRNMGFEEGFDGWRTGPVVDDVAVTEADAFTSPYEGTRMARLGTAAPSGQVPGPNTICQDWIVDEASESFVYNVFTYDYQGFDHFRFDVRVVDTDSGQLLALHEQGAWGSGTDLKTTGWQYVSLDLSDHLGKHVQLQISAGGTSDHLYNLFAYVDSAEKGAPPVVAPLASASSGSGSVMTDPSTGQVTVAMPWGAKSDLTLSSTPACPDGMVSSATAYLGTTAFPMTADGDTYSVTIPADQITSGVLSIQVVCTTATGTSTYVNPVGTVTLYDPSGIVSDPAGEPVVGAEVTLYKVPGWTAKTSPTDDSPTSCQSHYSKAPDEPWIQPAPTELGVLVNPVGNPEISPKVNPFITNDIGYYGWDVAAGCWYVVVKADGYHDLTSPVVGVPTEVTDLHLVLTPTGTAPVVAPTTATYTGASQGVTTNRKTTVSFNSLLASTDAACLAGRPVTFTVNGESVTSPSDAAGAAEAQFVAATWTKGATYPISISVPETPTCSGATAAGTWTYPETKKKK